MKIVTIVLFLSCINLNAAYSQQLQEGQKRWSAEDRLSVADFRIRISDENNDPVYSQIMISHAINGFDFLKKNMNQRIENIFVGKASWIDTSRVGSLEKQIDYQQIQFDLAEIHTRRFRKKVLENKGKITKGFNIINEISDEIMADFSEARVQFVKETEGGNNEQKLLFWREKIASELKELKISDMRIKKRFSCQNKAVQFSHSF